jgi:hypothetical protein
MGAVANLQAWETGVVYMRTVKKTNHLWQGVVVVSLDLEMGVPPRHPGRTKLVRPNRYETDVHGPAAASYEVQVPSCPRLPPQRGYPTCSE